MAEVTMSLASVLKNDYAKQLEDYISNKTYNRTIQDLGDSESLFRFFRKTLRGSYLFARIAVPSFGSHVFASLTEMPPIDDEMGRIVSMIMDVIREEICNCNIFERTGESHSHFLDALEAYKTAEGELEAIEEFFDLDARLGLEEAIKQSSFWSPGATAYGLNLIECCKDPLAIFIMMPVTETMVPIIFSRALRTLSEESRFDKFRKFLTKHVSLDGDDHGPAVLHWLKLYIDKTGKTQDEIRAATLRVLQLVSSGRFP